MAQPCDIGPTIIEGLYIEALVLTDETRAAFDGSVRKSAAGAPDEDLARIALSCEALRTTTRMMHALAWLLNQRAYFAGELSEFQLRRHGRLPPAQPDGDPAERALLDPAVAELVTHTRRFYARIEQLDFAWSARFDLRPAAVHRLRERLGRAVAGL
ncbi:MAG: DUF1465 family protein [Croceibacterium sp.]